MEHTFYIESLDLANDFEFYILNYESINYKREVSNYFYEFTIYSSTTIIKKIIEKLDILKSNNNYYKPTTTKIIRNVALEFIREKHRIKACKWGNYYSMEVITLNWNDKPKKEFKTIGVKSPKKKYHISEKPDKRGFYQLFDYTKSRAIKKKSVDRNKLVLYAKLHLD